jgi:competence protein ComFC
LTIGNIEINPQPLSSLHWSWGFALDVHTISSFPIGLNAFGNTEFATTRSPVGEMLYQLKYQNDETQVDAIAQVAAEFLRETLLPERAIDNIVPVPPSIDRGRQPVYALAQAIGALLKVPLIQDAVQRVSRTSAAKNTGDPDQRRRDQENAFAMNPVVSMPGAVILLFDDLYQSGSTSGAVARILKEVGKAEEVCFLAITKTRRPV